MNIKYGFKGERAMRHYDKKTLRKKLQSGKAVGERSYSTNDWNIPY